MLAVYTLATCTVTLYFWRWCLQSIYSYCTEIGKMNFVNHSWCSLVLAQVYMELSLRCIDSHFSQIKKKNKENIQNFNLMMLLVGI